MVALVGLEPSSQIPILTMTMRQRRFIIRVPRATGGMAPFEIHADSVQDLHRQARILFTHVWDRIVWPHGLEPENLTRADRSSR